MTPRRRREGDGAGSSITGISHVDLSVRDCEASARWYAEILGFEVRSRNVNERFGFPWIHLVLPDAGISIALVEHPGNAGEPFDEFRSGLDHLSFAVRDRASLDAFARRASTRGHPDVAIVESKDVAVIVLRDPDNIQIELCSGLASSDG
jgi:catechol 2,3-dioxygenase-like lactoylglutathione lyase family enzyme